MPELILLTGAGDERLSGEFTYAIVPLDGPRVRYLREQQGIAAHLAKTNTRFQHRQLADDGGATFVDDPDSLAEEETYGALWERVSLDSDSVIVRPHPQPATHVHKGRVSVFVGATSLSWELHRRKNTLETLPVHEGTIAIAWCLLCPEAEAQNAFRDLVRIFPDQEAEWLNAEVMRSDDGLFERPLPPISRDMLLPLLEHEENWVRQSAIMALGRSEVRTARRRP